MKWDLDRATAYLEKWAGISGPTAFTKRFVPPEILREFGFAKPGEKRMQPIWELSLLTNDGRRCFFGRTAHEAFLIARKALRPRRVRPKVDRFVRPAVEDT